MKKMHIIVWNNQEQYEDYREDTLFVCKTPEIAHAKIDSLCAWYKQAYELLPIVDSSAKYNKMMAQVEARTAYIDSLHYPEGAECMKTDLFSGFSQPSFKVREVPFLGK